MTSDRPPKEIPNLEERLVSRFQSGLVADIQPPDLETRIAILRKKAEGEGCAVPNEVLFFVAERVTSNIRDLEGCLTRVVALSSLSGQEITLQMAEDALRHILPATAKRIGIKEIQQAVAEFYSIPLEGMVSHRRTKELAFPRQMAMYVCRQKTTASLSEIGSQFGGKDHTTVLHALDKIQRLLEGNGETKAVLSQILSLLDQR
jgi:chromosomal replication initiator protein